MISSIFTYIMIIFLIQSFIVSTLAFDFKSSLDINLAKSQLRTLSESSISTCYGIVLDAGSSSTKVSIFNWLCREFQTIPYINISATAPSKSAKPGIATFASSLDKISTYMQPLFDYANAQVPASMKQYTLIVFSATAGMRMLSPEDQANILNVVRTIISQQGFLYVDPIQQVSVITGQQEGAYLWLTVNYLLNNLQITPQSVDQTVTVIDEGGASTQLSFYPRSTEITKNENIQLLLKGFNFYDLYSVSYLGYGNDQARQQVVSKYAERVNNGTTDILISPCFFQGYEDKWELNSSQVLRGSGDSAQCLQQIRQFLNASNCAYPLASNCGLNGTYQADIPKTVSIYAETTISIAAQFFKLDTSSYKISQLRDQYISLCELTWDEAQSTYGKSTYLWSMCFLGMYSQSLLIDGYKLDADQYIYSPSTIGQISPTWALGGMLYYVSQLYCYEDSPFCITLKKFFHPKKTAGQDVVNSMDKNYN